MEFLYCVPSGASWEDASSAEAQSQGSSACAKARGERQEGAFRVQLRRGCPSPRSISVMFARQYVQEMISLIKGSHYYAARFSRLGIFAFLLFHSIRV